jgi:hypothetical protein
MAEISYRRHRFPPVRLMRKLLMTRGFVPKLLVTDKLRRYPSAFHQIANYRSLGYELIIADALDAASVRPPELTALRRLDWCSKRRLQALLPATALISVSTPNRGSDARSNADFCSRVTLAAVSARVTPFAPMPTLIEPGTAPPVDLVRARLWTRLAPDPLTRPMGLLALGQMRA